MNPTTEQVAALAAEGIAYLDAIRRDAAELLRRSRELGGVGYPVATIPSPGGRSGVPDPVGALVASGTRDPIRTAVSVAFEDLVRALRVLRLMEGNRVFVVDPPKAATGRSSSVVDCANCGEPCLPRPISGRCSACYQYRRRTGSDRPVERAVEHALRCRVGS